MPQNVLSWGNKNFRGGPYISTLALKYKFRGVQIFRNIRTGGTIFGGSKSFVTGHVHVRVRFPINAIYQVKVMAGEVQLDALPYIDQGYEDPGVREAVRN